MGQQVRVDARVVGDVAVFDSDRSFTGQDGSAFGTPQDAADAGGFPGRLAARIFEADGDVDHVFVGSNGVTVRRSVSWDDAALRLATEVIGEFFVFYNSTGS